MLVEALKLPKREGIPRDTDFMATITLNSTDGRCQFWLRHWRVKLLLYSLAMR